MHSKFLSGYICRACMGHTLSSMPTLIIYIHKLESYSYSEVTTYTTFMSDHACALPIKVSYMCVSKINEINSLALSSSCTNRWHWIRVSRASTHWWKVTIAIAFSILLLGEAILPHSRTYSLRLGSKINGLPTINVHKRKFYNNIITVTIFTLIVLHAL